MALFARVVFASTRFAKVGNATVRRSVLAIRMYWAPTGRPCRLLALRLLDGAGVGTISSLRGGQGRSVGGLCARADSAISALASVIAWSYVAR